MPRNVDHRNATNCIAYCLECYEECLLCECSTKPGDLEEESAFNDELEELNFDVSATVTGRYRASRD